MKVGFDRIMFHRDMDFIVPIFRRSGMDPKNLKGVTYLYHLYIPRAPTTSIFEGHPRQNKAFSNQNKGHFFHLGSRYSYSNIVLLHWDFHLLKKAMFKRLVRCN